MERLPRRPADTAAGRYLQNSGGPPSGLQYGGRLTRGDAGRLRQIVSSSPVASSVTTWPSALRIPAQYVRFLLYGNPPGSVYDFGATAVNAWWTREYAMTLATTLHDVMAVWFEPPSKMMSSVVPTGMVAA